MRREADRTKARTEVGLPLRTFLYTLDQVASLLALSRRDLESRYIYFTGVSIEKRSKHLIVARNIGHPAERADWRVSEEEFIRWLLLKGFRLYAWDHAF